MERMEESGAGAATEGEPEVKESQQMEGTEEDPERGRPSTPKWWRPPIPPETYKWEEMRRQRQKGGYPWTHLDKEEDSDFDDYLDDNLYEPVNPPPLYGNDNYLSKDLQQVPQHDEPMIEIPPELDILTSEGLDGLDKPDPYARGFDGEREWQNDPVGDESPRKPVITESCLKTREARPSTPKSVGFSPETITHQVSDDLEEQEVPDQEGEEEIDDRPSSRASSGHSGHSGHSGGHGRRQTPFDILKAKAANCADHMKERIRKAIPVRGKISAEALRKSRRRKKVKHGQEELEPEGGEEGEKMEEGESPEQPGQSEMTTAEVEQQVQEVEPEEKEPEDEDEKAAKFAAKLQEEEELKRKKEEEKLQKQKEKEEQERIKAEEKLAKQKAAEEAKKAKEEEKARIAEEKQKAKEEAARIAAEKKKEEEARKAAEKAKKEEEARIAAEKKKEEDARKAAEKAKKDEEARIAAEAKKAEEEAKKAAEKARKEEEARVAAEKKAEEKARKEEEARIAAEKKAEEKARKLEEGAETADGEQVEEKAEEIAEEAAEEMEADACVANEEAEEEEMDVAPPQTPSGTTKRKYIRHRRQLPEIPNPITVLRNQVEDFKNKLKRSRTPPRRVVRKHKRRSRSADASKSPPRDLEDEPEEVEAEEQKPDEEDSKEKVEPKESVSESKPAVEVEVALSVATAEVVAESAQTSSAPEVAEAEPSIGGSEEPTEGPSTGTRGRTRRRQPAAEKIDKIGQTIGQSIKSIGGKSLDIVSQAGKVVGQNMKVVGKGVYKLGSEAMSEIKAKQEAAKQRKASQGVGEMNDETTSLPETEQSTPSVEPPKRAFRLRRRNESQEQADEEEMAREDRQNFYENAAQGHGQPQEENRLLGSGAKDWESPHDRGHSRDVSEEPYSGEASARDSPPGSSLASSNFARGGRTGVLEEIDSDEFFLRERGISEGEDAEEVNRFLVEELRQAFRPSMASNALAGFDMDDRSVPPPPRPDRTPRKPPRKDKEESSPSMYQTFPPERPKRKQPQGYVSKFMKEHEEEYDDIDSNEEVRGSSDEMRESESVEGDEGIELLKAKLSKIESEEEETQVETTVAPPEPQELEEEEVSYEDDGRYEPINEGPTKPTRTKRSKPKRPPTPPSFYYNTIAANEWLRELESTENAEPAPPMRKRRGSGKSDSVSRSEEGVVVGALTLQHLEDQIIISPPTTAQTEQREAGIGAAGDYIDEAGYAIVQKDREVPTTIPRKKKKRVKELQTGLEQMDPTRAFFSMPRAAPRNIDAVPPERPNRTYSTLRPRRPPRSKSGSRQSIDRSPASIRREGDESRPSNVINLMQGRPLPPPPRPVRSPALERRIDLGQELMEQAIGLRHYANFDDIEPHTLEEVLTTPPPPRVMEVDIACQTDPVPEDEFIVGSLSLNAESLMEDGSRIITASSRLERSETRPEGRSSTPTTAGDVSTSFQTPRLPPPPQPPPPHTQSSQTQPQTEPLPPTQPPPFVFPSRLHLHELEVDFIKVNELCAQTIKVGSLQASQIEAHSINATGSVCAPHIRAQSVQSDIVNCSKLSSDTVDTSTIPPLSFYQLSSPDDQLRPGSEQEFLLKTEEKEERENESACPLEYDHDSMQSLLGNVDSTNDMKSSHVAEKVLDKQLNVAQSSPESDQKTKTKKDASVGTPSLLSRNVPVQMNNLNQESSSSITQSITAQQLQNQSENISAPPQQETGRLPIDLEESADDPPIEEAVVVGSYTLPYSYMPSPPTATPTPTTRERSSLRRSQRSRRSQSPGEEAPKVAFGHTTTAQGEVLSVKLSIPVEPGALPPRPPTPPATAPPRLHRTISSTTETPSGSPAESAKKNVQKESERGKPPTPILRRASSGTSQQPPPRPPPPAPPQVPGGVDTPASNESILETSIRLGRAVLRFTMRSLQAMADYIDTASSDDPGKVEQQRANMQVLLCLLLVLVVGLILATTRSGPYITPRWEFLMPPPDL